MQIGKILNSRAFTSSEILFFSGKLNDLNGPHRVTLESFIPQKNAQTKSLDFLRVTERGEFQVSNEALQALRLSSSNSKTAYLEDTCKEENLKPIREIFDKEGRLVEQIAPDGSVHYSIRYQNKITEILNVLTGEVHVMERNDQGHLIRETYSSGLEVRYAWNGDTLSEITMPDQSKILYLEKEGYYAVIQRISKEGNLLFQQSIRISESEGVEISLFDEPALIRAVYDSETNCLTTKSETLCLVEEFDAEGNLVSKTYKDPVSGDETTHFCPSEDLLLNRKRKLDEQNRVISADDWKCRYDENGRLIEKRSSSNVISYQYDALDRLTHIKQGSLEIEYTYDFLGRRLSKTKRENGEVKKEFYLYHGMNEMGVYDEKNQPIHLKVPALQVHPYICLASHIESKGKTYVPFYNSNLNIAQLIDIETQEIHHYESLDPFAENLSQLNPICPWIYQGKHFDMDTGLIHFIHRQYDPSIQQWTSKDPDSDAEVDDLYIYCRNNPYRYIDPDGKWIVNFGTVIRCARLGASIGGFWGGVAGATVGLVAGPVIAKGINKAAGHIKNKDLAMALTGVGGAIIGAAIDKVQEMPAFPDKGLPRYPAGGPLEGEPLPDTDAPHTQLGHRKGRKETYPQAREFGENGEPIRDIDFTDHCRPQNHPLPHQHRYKDNPTGGTKERDDEGELVPEWEYENN